VLVLQLKVELGIVEYRIVEAFAVLDRSFAEFPLLEKLVALQPAGDDDDDDDDASETGQKRIVSASTHIIILLHLHLHLHLHPHPNPHLLLHLCPKP
jgi:hypothetical protein